ncbi:ABC transporter permease [Solirhodobacter olei]|uniref:ABC transporter permease n=1 Tax=Solirhodobacter olei TaxID=2493082 RepID=UPI000FDA0392|nr:ABC transporter permease [Solirhodobacter olei]
MLRFLTRRMLLLVPVVLGVATLTFMLMHMAPGDPARTYLGDRANPAAIAALRHEWGLDQPLWRQYLNFMGGLAVGDLGRSMFFHDRIITLLAIRLPPTLWLMAMATLFSIVISVPLATWMAVSRGGAVDAGVRSFNAIAQGTPLFFTGAVLIAIFSLNLHWFPVAGYGNTVSQHIASLILPSLSVALVIVPFLIRGLRGALMDALNSEYVNFAKAKGLNRRAIWINYALKNASITGISILGIQVGYLAGGSLVIENVFAIPGMGTFLMKGILNRDFPVVQASALVFALLVIFIYLLTDIAYGLFDPRVRLK